MVDSAAVGTTGEPFVMDLEAGKIREFARAVRSSSVASLGDKPAVDGPVIPPTFLTTAFFWQTGASDPWTAVAMDQSRGLHAEQEFVFHGPPPRAGQRLVGTSRITEVYEKQGRNGTLTFAVMVTEFRDESGTLVASATLTGVET
ncbi:FAS1-like dehydratase domain-containing protein [Virgisporangium aurantiacum]|uniref:FAS1-like dehydratase domain-containing protein n=1 Tax=Virgisporangium aurantiacum TaxID=175570 RepID=A0A8J3Z1M4_9ACTN|nr:MaoC family dehydratase N-terminal domain-containing protein [Virgisporangium aurantiacum]GIJ54618.1 hypothetical protein Vau01_021340 [Virgisporangium aurantiacum]